MAKTNSIFIQVGGSSLISTQIAFGNTSNVITGDSNFTYNNGGGMDDFFGVGFSGSDFIEIDPQIEVIGANPNFRFGDINDSNGGHIGVFDITGLNSGATTGWGAHISESGPGKQYFAIERRASTGPVYSNDYLFGDINSLVGGTGLRIHFHDDGAGGLVRQVMIGDDTPTFNGTFITIDDINRLISLKSDSGVIVNNLSGFGTGFVAVDNNGKLSWSAGSGSTPGLGAVLTIDPTNGGTAIQGSNFMAAASDSIDILTNTHGSPIISIDSNGGLIFRKSISSPSMDVVVSGDAVISNNSRGLYYDPVSLVPSATITMPVSPTDGQELLIQFGGTTLQGAATPVITALTIAANSGQILIGTYPTSATTNTTIELKYRERASDGSTFLRAWCRKD